MTVKPCAEGDFLQKYGADCRGCMTLADYENAIGKKLNPPKSKIQTARPDCACFLGADIGAYDTCGHLCRYCYANNDVAQVAINRDHHNPKSQFLVGDFRPGDIIHDVEQKSWVDNQMDIFQFI